MAGQSTSKMNTSGPGKTRRFLYELDATFGPFRWKRAQLLTEHINDLPDKKRIRKLEKAAQLLEGVCRFSSLKYFRETKKSNKVEMLFKVYDELIALYEQKKDWESVVLFREKKYSMHKWDEAMPPHAGVPNAEPKSIIELGKLAGACSNLFETYKRAGKYKRALEIADFKFSSHCTLAKHFENFRLLSAAIDNHIDAAEILWLKAGILEKTGKKEEAKLTYRKMGETYTQATELYRKLMTQLKNAGDISQEETLKREISIAEARIQAFMDLTGQTCNPIFLEGISK